VQTFRAAPASAFESLPPALALCRAGSPIPDACFIEPAEEPCPSVLGAVARALQQPELPEAFRDSVRPGCFQLGSMLQGGAESGSCFPQGLRERAEMESFMLAFDSNLAPSVGQQVTFLEPDLRGGGARQQLLATLLASAERGSCDAIVFSGASGYLVRQPRPLAAGDSELEDARGQTQSLRRRARSGAPLTLTCYPPQPGQAEARRVAFSRSVHR
jgi:hypothetical protein